MKQYIGTKLIQAEEAIKYTTPGGRTLIKAMDEGWSREENDILDAGAAAEMGYRVRYADGYESWSPKAVFETAYRLTKGMNFGLALEAAKKGKRIARAGWNGKGMYVFLADDVEFHCATDISELYAFDFEVGDVLVLRTAQANLQPGWLASQSDMLADDWCIVDKEVQA